MVSPNVFCDYKFTTTELSLTQLGERGESCPHAAECFLFFIQSRLCIRVVIAVQQNSNVHLLILTSFIISPSLSPTPPSAPQIQRDFPSTSCPTQIYLLTYLLNKSYS